MTLGGDLTIQLQLQRLRDRQLLALVDVVVVVVGQPYIHRSCVVQVESQSDGGCDIIISEKIHFRCLHENAEAVF